MFLKSSNHFFQKPRDESFFKSIEEKMEIMRESFVSRFEVTLLLVLTRFELRPFAQYY